MFAWLRRLLDRAKSAEAVGGPLDGQRLLTMRTPWSCVLAVTRIHLQYGFIEAGEFAAVCGEQALEWHALDSVRVLGTYHLAGRTFEWHPSKSDYLNLTRSEYWRRWYSSEFGA